MIRFLISFFFFYIIWKFLNLLLGAGRRPQNTGQDDSINVSKQNQQSNIPKKDIIDAEFTELPPDDK